MKKRGQIWVETMIYTLIAFTMISLVLAFVRPAIGKMQDQRILDQSVILLEDLNDVINSLGSAGNQRVAEVGISKGTLKIDGLNESIGFEMESKHEYSQPGENVPTGNVLIHTKQTGDIYDVNLTINYENYNIKYEGSDEIKLLGRSATPYKILISHEGQDNESKTIVNIKVVG